MQKFGQTFITKVGQQMLTKVDGAQGEITYTKTVLYTQDIKGMSNDERFYLTELTGEQIVTKPTVVDIQDTTVTINASFNNAQVTQDLTFNSIGWFAKTSVDDKEQLLATTPSEMEQTLVAGTNGAATSSIDIDLAFARSHNTTVVVRPPEEGLVSPSQMNTKIKEMKETLEAEFPEVIAKTKEEINQQINSLSALTDTVNSLNKTQIDLDEYDSVGITKFTDCQLQSLGFKANPANGTTNVSGWIFNIPLNKDEPTYQQIVYVCDGGSDSRVYMRNRIGSDNKKTEIFEKIFTDADLSTVQENVKNIHDALENDVAKISTISKPVQVNNDINPDTITQPGIYYSDNGFNFGQKAPTDYRPGKSYLLVMFGDRSDKSFDYYQQFLFQATKNEYNVWYRAEYKYDTDSYYTFDFQNLKDIYGSLRKISLNGGKPIEPDSSGIVNLNVPEPDLSSIETKADAKAAHDLINNSLNQLPKTVNDIKPDKTGNIPISIPDIGPIKQDITTVQGQMTEMKQSMMKTWTGTLTQYQALTSYDPMTIYFIISDYEVVVK
ncbi:MAG: hypothetical protein M3Z53_02725 [Lactobacillus panisapium]|nr:hypothetical protein [Lactobacillus panisapium]